jgi:hypothetical protein
MSEQRKLIRADALLSASEAAEYARKAAEVLGSITDATDAGKAAHMAEEARNTLASASHIAALAMNEFFRECRLNERE